MRFLIAIEEEVSLSEQNNCPLPGSIEARVMHTSVLLLAVTWLLLPLRSHALTLTYWLDDNCGDDVKRAINEARTGSSRMLTRMNTQAEHPYMYWLQEAIHRGGTPEISNYIFSTYKSFVGRITDQNLRPVGDEGKAGSDVRIYCDNDDRWQPVPDDPDPNVRKNSQRGLFQPFIDKDNYIRRTKSGLGCKSDRPILASTYYSYNEAPGTPANQNKRRATITLCNRLLDQKQLYTYQEVIDRRPPSDWPDFKFIDLITTHTIIHELMHHPQINTARPIDDHPDRSWVIPPGGEESDRPKKSGYNWSGVMGMTADDSGNLETKRNPDSFAYWVGLGRFWDNQYVADQADQFREKGKFRKDGGEPKNEYKLDPPKKGAEKVLRRLFGKRWVG